ncbi:MULTISPECIES: hypothetical protein [Idiomarinaceae]|uniref:Uncharacterized protein n=1 Tax=Pseudidiomarina fusca TaxID=2965078 RepID=A0ABU3KUE2_9GAMM|nr:MULTISPECIES: hypothetical protein [Idiomarinaceae]MDX1526230.1 hypothetical protein [Pseudidiomarina maritima]MDT7525119.1 hypothetical protein [Pseudidiomarina sp. GXY010]MRJ42921.1 hypothetical protein [Idiomarina sp. FeN1]NCU58473.1 hypothetical protein [Idiomarina sp. FenA--70]NCU61170.1 hypothetical protein [Idiomarina sp. FenBw--71]
MNTVSTEENTSSLSQWFVNLAPGDSCARITLPASKVQQELRDGIDACVIDSLQHFIPLTLIADALGLTERTIKLKVANQIKLNVSQSDTLLYLVRTWCKLLAFFDGRRDILLMWLNSEARALEQTQP